MNGLTLEKWSLAPRAPPSGAFKIFQARPARSAEPLLARHAELSSERRVPGLSSVFAPSSFRGARQLTVRAGAYEAYPFNQEDYNRVVLHAVATPAPPASQGIAQGTLLLMRSGLNGMAPDEDQRILEVGVSGDTLLAVTNQARNETTARPLSLDLLWQILERNMERQRPEWQLLRVAIVDLQSFVFVGRLFFGDRETGEVAWDCDCRFSDAVWLAQKTNAPIFVRKSIWNMHAHSIRSMPPQQEFRSHLQATSVHREAQAALKASRAMLEQHMASSSHAHTVIRFDDPEPVKRLKRELEVAVREEDFAAAVRIRDHPFMKLHREILVLRASGDQEKAELLQSQLQQAINASVQQSQGPVA